mmetsp:Transcript_36753/g.57462  ORF Transcript_36753/g.57462 Transcript_36753/m.57462 type:complete len:329 (+) Transcript_36753:498-1484(+)|eukprot:CAMPEP_0184305876 /NCGR_PEP_ID=MMETSP1049-20130417/15035_1 /TAXON_ID=77928 /ORGANISM="Proteomonas sulcata, Strain CCMP704" /LENGTH=328 /DNA_ID=CAMNT_0026618031 /DNA_START=385 /DNA_END=1371 /DNA_ORIENTATION=+
MITVCGMLAGGEGGPFTYEHCISVRGDLVWARPPRGDCYLFNADEVRGKIVVMRRGGVSFTRKVNVAQEAGAVGLVCVGWDTTEEKYKPPIMRITTGEVPGDDLPSPRTLNVDIPCVYALQKLGPALQEGATAYLHFDAKSPPGWKAGCIYIKGEEQKTRNPEGEAKAQWNEADLTFDKGKTMVGSDGRVIALADSNKGAPPRQLKCEATKTATKSRRDCRVGILGSDVVMYGFKMMFGGTMWEIQKRYSDFDSLDKKLNSTYGLPPVGLPPKQWFGLSDPALIQFRHNTLTSYLQDCIKRPVLVLSTELQEFTNMPDEVVASVKRGG